MHYTGIIRTLVIAWLKIKSKLTGYGYFGNYKSWQEASAESIGYDEVSLIKKVKTASLAVKDGEATFERDGIAFNEKFDWEVLPWFQDLLAERKVLNVLDFGGALGSHYYPLAKLFGKERLNWTILEQDAFVEIGKKEFANEQLHFTNKFEEKLKEEKFDLVLFGCVLPYLSNPYEVLNKVKEAKIPNIIIDKHPLIQEENDRITIQRINPKIYAASYPAWFFSESKFLGIMEKEYRLEKVLTCPDIFNVNSYFKSYFYKLNQ